MAKLVSVICFFWWRWRWVTVRRSCTILLHRAELMLTSSMEDWWSDLHTHCVLQAESSDGHLTADGYGSIGEPSVRPICSIVYISQITARPCKITDHLLKRTWLADCPKECTRRCSKASRHERCMTCCTACCHKCNCVPSGTYAHKEECPCYANMKDSHGKPKCPW